MYVLTYCWQWKAAGVGCAATWRTPSRAGCHCPCRVAGAANALRRTPPLRCRTASAARPTCRPRAPARSAAARARAYPTRTRPPPQSCRPTGARLHSRAARRAIAHLPFAASATLTPIHTTLANFLP